MGPRWSIKCRWVTLWKSVDLNLAPFLQPNIDRTHLIRTALVRFGVEHDTLAACNPLAGHGMADVEKEIRGIAG